MQVKTKNLIVSVLVVLLVGMLWYRVVYSSMESKASKAKTAAHEADATAANLRQALNGASSSKKATKGHDVAADVMLGAVPVDAAEASFLRGVDQIRLDSGAQWQTITPAPSVTAGGVTTINVGITAQGTEDQIARYVAGLTDLKRIFVMDNVSIVAGGANGGAGSNTINPPAGAAFFADKLQLQVSGRIFSQSAAAALTPGATTGASGTTPASGTSTGSSGSSPAGGSTPSGGATSPSGIQNN